MRTELELNSVINYLYLLRQRQKIDLRIAELANRQAARLQAARLLEHQQEKQDNREDQNQAMWRSRLGGDGPKGQKVPNSKSRQGRA
jgi:hypothetical protein